MTMRKIIQISSIFLPEGSSYDPAVHVYALCDDGGVWEHVTATDKWTPLPAIPQDEPETLPKYSTDKIELPYSIDGYLWLVYRAPDAAPHFVKSLDLAFDITAVIDNFARTDMILVLAGDAKTASRYGRAWFAGNHVGLVDRSVNRDGRTVTYVGDKSREVPGWFT